MAAHFCTTTCTRAVVRATLPSSLNPKFQNPDFVLANEPPEFTRLTNKSRCRITRSSRIHASTTEGDSSYLDMWKKAVDRDRKSTEFERITGNVGGISGNVGGISNAGEEEEEEEEEKAEQSLNPEEMERKTKEFMKMLEMSTEERDRIQGMQVIDRAAAAIAAAKSLLKEDLLSKEKTPFEMKVEDSTNVENHGGIQSNYYLMSSTRGTDTGTPGPNFWSWTPPLEKDSGAADIEVKPATKAFADLVQSNPVIEKERPLEILSIPFESSIFQGKPPLPPLQALVEVEKSEVSDSTQETSHVEVEHELGIEFSTHAAEAVEALREVSDESSQGVNPDGSRWWKETGLDRRPDGVVCKWTLSRGVSADKTVEWEDKYWEAADEFGYKELGSQKSGRDATGNVWREYWRESMSQNCGLVHLEKTADKWGKNGKGDEWQEQWWEHYGASGQAEKWAHKWCSIDPYTPLEAGHAHVWHERWGEKYDGKGGSIKYTDKWAERFQGDGWEKWGDKWDENFDLNGCGVKQGETWWAGKYGDSWNRTWGEGHNGTGWVHKYGKSSSGEHWDTHVQQDTWYEKFPHYGFYHCFNNSVQLREVKNPSEW